MWAIRLLSIACLSLAAKMEECQVPSLSEYDVEECSFDADVIQRMELLVLNTLEWKMICVTPFTYLSYFVTVFCGQFRPKDLINRAVQLISAIMAGILTNYVHVYGFCYPLKKLNADDLDRWMQRST